MHSTNVLLFFVAQDITDAIREGVRQLVVKLATSHEWVIQPPKFVDVVDESSASATDLPVETVGGVLEIYSAMPPSNLPRDVDQQHFDEVTTLVEAICSFSREHSLTFEFELDGNFVGAVEGGKMDLCLSEGFLGEWRRHLGMAGEL